MKKSLSIFLISVILVASLVGCSNKSKKVLIGISIPSADHGWLEAVNYYAQTAGTEFNVDCKILKADSEAAQSTQIDELIKAKCDAIVLLPLGNQEVAAKKILDEKIPLINLDRKVEVDSTVYLSGDNSGIGKNAAIYFNKALNGKGNVAMISVPTAGSINVERSDAFKAELKEYPELTLLGSFVANSYKKADGVAVMNEILAKHSQVDAVFTGDDELTLGVLQAINDSGRKDIKVISGGAGAKEVLSKMRDSEILLASPLYSPAMIKECVKIASEIVITKRLPEKRIIKPATLVDKTNVSEYYDEKSPY